MNKKEFFHKFNLDIKKGFVLIVQHSITEQSGESEVQMLTTLQAISEIDIPAVLIHPNNDAGSLGIQNALESIDSIDIHVKRNVDRELYANLMKYAKFIIGNSSSGLLEAPTFGLPAINIGRRQIGRLQAKNVVNVDFNKGEIKDTIHYVMNDKEFLANLETIENPYGDGHSSKRIVGILENIEIDSSLLNKELTY